nr:MAG TPA: hypothetical protein [Caudoviricetes sp.]
MAISFPDAHCGVFFIPIFRRWQRAVLKFKLRLERLPQGRCAILHAATVHLSGARWWKMWRRASIKSG